MSANKGIVFSVEAVVAAGIFLAILLMTLSVIENSPSHLESRVIQDMQIAHDMIVENVSDPPTGFAAGDDCKNSGDFVVLKVHTRSAEVCMR